MCGLFGGFPLERVEMGTDFFRGAKRAADAYAAFGVVEVFYDCAGFAGGNIEFN